MDSDGYRIIPIVREEAGVAGPALQIEEINDDDIDYDDDYLYDSLNDNQIYHVEDVDDDEFDLLMQGHNAQNRNDHQKSELTANMEHHHKIDETTGRKSANSNRENPGEAKGMELLFQLLQEEKKLLDEQLNHDMKLLRQNNNATVIYFE